MIIAEASLQHNGTAFAANAIVRKAKEAGADAVKFQMFVHGEGLFCPLEGDEARWAKWCKSIMSFEQWNVTKQSCDEIGIVFMASVFQHGAVDLYKSLNPKWWKVASRAAETFPYEKGQNYIISDGFSQSIAVLDLDDFHAAKKLQCRPKYPHPLERWERHDGLSDHSGSPWPSIDALARGAEIVEVHVDFDGKKLPEEITLDQLKLICEARDVFAAMRQG